MLLLRLLIPCCEILPPAPAPTLPAALHGLSGLPADDALLGRSNAALLALRLEVEAGALADIADWGRLAGAADPWPVCAVAGLDGGRSPWASTSSLFPAAEPCVSLVIAFARQVAGVLAF